MVDTATPITKEDEEHCLTQYYFGKPNGSCTRDILKSKENILRSKLCRNLKKKLKKYKLKKNGTEDPEILDVSQKFNRTLTLSSPNKGDKSQQLNEDRDKSENYLTKMARHKQSSLTLKKGEISKRESKPVRTGHNHSEDTKTDTDNVSKKQTNAFKLLMDSRNKSIGSNSPGKDKSLNESETEDVVEITKIKVKRNLALQKMADAKGALKKKELEEIQEACIKDKMDKRAERLTKMLIKGNKKKKKKCTNHNLIGKDEENENICKASHKKTSETLCNRDSIGEDENDGFLREKINSLVSPKHKKILKEDEEFSSKLSPSIKKKENMLCYFRKIHKEPDVLALVPEVQCQAAENQEKEIGVKPVLKAKNKSKHRKLSLNTNMNMKKEVDCNENNTVMKTKDPKLVEKNTNVSISDDTKSRKRKRRPLVDPSLKDTAESSTINNTSEVAQISEGRPKRNIKKPVKYNDAHLSSSDEELHVFTPKKKKHISFIDITKENPKDPQASKINDSKEQEKDVVVVPSKIKKENVKPSATKNVTKLAPIFKKTQIDPVALEAKQRFLQSGIPEQLKKHICQQRAQDVVTEFFCPVVHVHQNKPTSKVSLNEIVEYDDSDSDCKIPDLTVYGENDIKNLLQINQTKERISVQAADMDVQETLKNIKESYPQFPVYRTYKTLSSKKNGDHKDLNCTDLDNSSEVLNGAVEIKQENSDQLTWCTKYRATSTNQILGNFDSIQELRKWLITWTNNDACAKNNDDSDSDFAEYDTDSRDSLRISNNLLALSGPIGSGKTSSVYAVAAELAIKVIEVNVSSKRTGKILLQDLQEATQSHKVNRGKGSSTENSQEFFRSKTKSQGSKKQLKKYKGASNGVVSLHTSESQSQSQEDGRTGMSLILIDDADVVFDQDDGFVSAIAQLIQCSKRPVILVVTSLNCLHLQKFLLSGTILKMNSLSPRILGTWLDVMCLVDTKLCWPGMGEKCLDYFSGDIRKAINCLHFLLASETQKCTEENTQTFLEEQKIITESQDENSNFSWTDQDQIEDKEELNHKCSSQNHAGYHLISSTLRTTLNNPLDLFHVWWSLPTILKTTNNTNECKESNKDSLKKLESISNTLDSISLADCFSYKVKPDSRLNISSSPWICEETDSVSERENLEDVNNAFEFVKEMSQVLVASTLNIARRTFKTDKTDNSDIGFPGLAEQRFVLTVFYLGCRA